MICRRDFIKRTLVSSAALVSTQFPSSLQAQDTDEYQRILFDGIVDGDFGFDFLRSVSWQFIGLRSLLGGPFEYESQPFWVSGAQAAWSAGFSPFLGRNGQDMLLADRSSVFEAMAADRIEFAQSEFGQSLASALQETYLGQQKAFTGWCSEAGISPNGRLFNSIISAQALFAVQFATYNEARMIEAGGRGFFDNFTWVWPFCGG